MKKLIMFVTALLMMSSAVFVYAEEAENLPPPQLTKVYESEESILSDFVLDGYIYSKNSVVENPVMVVEVKEVSETKTANSKVGFSDTIPYEDEDGYIGELQRGSITSSINGYTTRSYAITDTKFYYNLPSKDLANIPKSVTKDNVNLTISGIQWIDSTNDNTGNTAVGSGFTCKVGYEGSYTKREPTGYTYSVTYSGEVSREYVERIEYEVMYVGELIPEPEKPFNALPIAAGAAGTGGIAGVLWFFFLKKNTFVYNLQNGAYTLIGKLTVNSNSPIVNLDKMSHKVTTNMYKIQVSKGLATKLTGRDISVTSKGHSLNHRIPNCEGDYSFDITI